MRLTLLLLLIPCVVHAGGVLIVPENDLARSVMDGMVEQLARPGLSLKTAGPRAAATACLNENNQVNRGQCLMTAATSANVTGLLLVRARATRSQTTVHFEVVSQSTGKSVFSDVLKGPENKVVRSTGPVAKKLVPILLALSKEASPEKAPERTPERAPERTPEKAPAITPEPSPGQPPSTARTPEATPVEPVAVARPAADAPRAMALEPAPVKPSPVQVTSPEPRPRVAAWTVTTLTVAGAITAVAAGAMGWSNKTKVEAETNRISDLSYREAVQLQATANQQLTIALGSAVGAAVCGGVSAYLWSRE